MPPPVRLYRWAPRMLAIVALALVPWTLWLTFSLPSRHVTQHYDLAWIGFDVALAGAFGATAWSAFRRPRWLAALAAATGTMLVCDAWFDVVASSGGGERLEAVAQAVFAEIPLAAICAYIVYDTERFRDGVRQIRPPKAAARRATMRGLSEGTRAGRPKARARPDRHA